MIPVVFLTTLPPRRKLSNKSINRMPNIHGKSLCLRFKQNMTTKDQRTTLAMRCLAPGKKMISFNQTIFQLNVIIKIKEMQFLYFYLNFAKHFPIHPCTGMRNSRITKPGKHAHCISRYNRIITTIASNGPSQR